MAWRPSEFLIEGELDNTTPGKVTGWIKFKGRKEKIQFDLNGNFHRDIRGAKIKLSGDGKEADLKTAKEYLKHIAAVQTGNVGDMTAGREPVDYVDYPYIEWYGDRNGRCVIELNKDQVELLSKPIPACESDPISSEEQNNNMSNFISNLCKGLKKK